MKLLSSLLILGMPLMAVRALEITMDQSRDNKQYCAGMYSRSTWGGPVDPFILVKFLPSSDNDEPDPTVALVIFEWRDGDFVGIPDPDGGPNRLALCDTYYVDEGYCNSTDIGEFIITSNATEKSNALILTKSIHLDNSVPINYSIKKTGYYCILTEGLSADNYRAVVELRNAYGELPATQIPKLPFYGGITILYALMAVYWGFLYYQHRHDILPVQNYITAILLFLVVEMILTWGFYDYQNRNGSTVGSKVFLTVVSILNAARNSFSFFLLLIVCMGYGVVKPSLGRAMLWARALALVQFVFGVIYSITSHLIAPETAGPFVLLIVLPLAGTLTGFYVWTLNSLKRTLKDLRERKQTMKESMYRKLWWALVASIAVIVVFFCLNSMTFASVNDPDFVPFHWKTRWFILDGWLNVVYWADVAFVAYVWRPTAHNRRFAMSDEIAQVDEGTFEIGNIGLPGDSDDSDDSDDELHAGKPTSPLPPLAGAASRTPRQEQMAGARQGRLDSTEAETIFAVGDDGDKFSDDGDKFSDDGSDEDAKLVQQR